MVFPKINHGFLSADQQLIRRRLIKGDQGQAGPRGPQAPPDLEGPQVTQVKTVPEESQDFR
ncbi:hypothetical protein ANANG_G00139570 [Anguilla anguilla]|uniref:Uncharacterized protein n=1 Tax=Anguilla anguilla TaxID=7936 RepID=A0A9D3MAI9_ANGAN|nr:hypothetical protein ANANG_G00139570 [Anguilla anguilla]